MRPITLLFITMLTITAIAQETERNIWPEKKPADVSIKEGKMKQTMGKDAVIRRENKTKPRKKKTALDDVKDG